MKSFAVLFEFEKSTKNTHRFKEVRPDDDTPPVIGTLYVQRSAFGKSNAPDSIKVTVEQGL